MASPICFNSHSKNVNHVIYFKICVTFTPVKMLTFKRSLNAANNEK